MGQLRSSKTSIREIIYIPSHVNVQPEELEENDYLHDDHFCSLLCDQGMVVHVMRLHSLNKGLPSALLMGHSDNSDSLIISMLYTEAITQVINSRMKQPRMTTSAIGIVAKELSCSRVLTYLAHAMMEISTQSNTYNINSQTMINSSQFSQSKLPVGAVMLIDPPPLLSLQSNPLRAPLSILQRYIEPLHSPSAYQRCVTPTSTPSTALRLWQRCYREYQSAEGAGISLMKSSLLHLMKQCYPDSTTLSSQDTNNNTPLLECNDVDFQDNTIISPIINAVTPTIETTTITTTATTPTRSDKLEELILAEELRLLEYDEYIDSIDPYAKRLRTIKQQRSTDRSTPSSSLLTTQARPSQAHPTVLTATRTQTTSLPPSMVQPPFVLSPTAIVGNFPPKASLVASMMKGRMMVVDSQSNSPVKSQVKSSVKFSKDDVDDQTPTDSNDNEGDDEGDDWGYTACEELARLYQADQVLRLMHNDDDDDDDDDDEGEDGVADQARFQEQEFVDETIPGLRQEDIGPEQQEQEQEVVPSFRTLTWYNIEPTKRPCQNSAHTSQISSSSSENMVLSKKRRRQLQSPSYVKLLEQKGWIVDRMSASQIPSSQSKNPVKLSSQISPSNSQSKMTEDEEDLIWSAEIRQRHRRLARVLGIWIDQLR